MLFTEDYWQPTASRDSIGVASVTPMPIIVQEALEESMIRARTQGMERFSSELSADRFFAISRAALTRFLNI